MRIITEPKVTVVGRSTFVPHPDYETPADGTDFERIGALAAKTCYGSFGAEGRSNRENQRAVIESQHGSVLEHLVVSLFIEGITRACSLELNRHRGLSISQRSTRYTKEEDAAIVLNPELAGLYIGCCNAAPMDPEDVALVRHEINSAEQALANYRQSVRNWTRRLTARGLTGFDLRKAARGKARDNLPHNLETQGVWTGNLRTWRWIVELRSERHAEAEIRRLANHIYNALTPIAGTYFEDFEDTSLFDGISELVPQYRKV